MPLAGVGPTTLALGPRCSIHVSYRGIKSTPGGARTPIDGVEIRGIVLYATGALCIDR
jgi:hypothetical protein